MTVLIVGSYPPVPVAGAPVTVDEVRRVWERGGEVTVVSPRLSAAHLAVPVHGALAGRRLANVRKVTGTDRLVLVIEEGFPVPSAPLPFQLLVATALARSLRGFRHVRLVRAGPAFLPAAVERRLRAAADEFEQAHAGATMAGVTPLGPTEVSPADRARQVAARAARRLLGSRAPAVRARLAAGRSMVRVAAPRLEALRSRLPARFHR